MLNKKISFDEIVAKLSLKSALFFTWCIPNLDIGGKILGDSHYLKGNIVPYRADFSIKDIEKILVELSESGLITVYGNSYKYLKFNGFEKNQKLNPDKEAESEIPDPTPDQLQSNSRLTLPKDKLKISISKEEEEVLSHWNTFAKDNGLSTILSLSGKRRRGISTRLKENQFDLRKIFEQIEKSDFLKGKNDRGWKVDFDFIFCSANNYLKIMEGKYANNKGSVRKPNYVSPEEIADDLSQAFSQNRATT